MKSEPRTVLFGNFRVSSSIEKSLHDLRLAVQARRHQGRLPSAWVLIVDVCDPTGGSKGFEIGSKANMNIKVLAIEHELPVENSLQLFQIFEHWIIRNTMKLDGQWVDFVAERGMRVRCARTVIMA